MKIILTQQFPLGRFHANPWKAFTFDDPYGEWPPSPWRLLRAIIARSYQLEREQPDVNATQREALSHAFCSSKVSWRLPEFSWRGPGLRQYQPTEFKKVPAAAKEPGQMTYNTTKVQDNFWLTASSAPPLFWFLEGEDWKEETLRLLDACLARMTYFGRAESITEISRHPAIAGSVTPNCSLQAQRTATSVPVLCPLPDATLDQAQLSTDEKAVTDSSTPPGAVWRFADRPALSARKNQTKCQVIGARKPTRILQFALGGRVFPPVQSWIRLTERFRGATLDALARNVTGQSRSRFRDLSPEQRSEFSLMTGKNQDDSPCLGHRHTFFFLLPDAAKNPTRLVCYRHEPFTMSEQEAMLTASEMPLSWEYGSSDWLLRVVPLPIETALPNNILGPAVAWESATPYVTSRYIFGRSGKPKSGMSVTSQIAVDLAQSGFPSAQVVVPDDENEKHGTWIKIHQSHRNRGRQTNDMKRGYHLKLVFPSPVAGPIAVGHSCHFGLGLFVPVDARGSESDEYLSLGAPAEEPGAHVVHEKTAEYGLVEPLGTEERALVNELVEDGLAIQDRFRPEPLYRQTGKGHFEARTVEDIHAARKQRERDQ